MRLTYDPGADALDIRLHEGHYECRTVRLTQDIALDFADGEQLVSIEILGASALGITPEHPEIHLDGLRGIVEKAASL